MTGLWEGGEGEAETCRCPGVPDGESGERGRGIEGCIVVTGDDIGPKVVIGSSVLVQWNVL